MPEKYLTPAQVCEIVPNITVANLAQRRFLGLSPKFLKPTPKTVLYRESDVIAWVEESEQSITGAAAGGVK